MIADSEFGVKKNLGSPVFEIFAVFPRIGRFLRFYENKIEGNEIEASGLLDQQRGIIKWLCKRKNEKKLKTRILVDFLNLKFQIFSIFEHFFFTFSIFPMKMWYLRYTRNYVIFRTFNYEENGRKKLKKCWKVTILQFFLQNLTYVEKKIEHFESNSKYILYIACSNRNFTLM